MTNDLCLHCVLVAAVKDWERLNRRATNDDIVKMIGQFSAETLAEYGGKPVTLVILEKTFSSQTDTVH